METTKAAIVLAGIVLAVGIFFSILFENAQIFYGASLATYTFAGGFLMGVREAEEREGGYGSCR